MNNKKRPFVYIIEGTDCSGKSTLAYRISKVHQLQHKKSLIVECSKCPRWIRRRKEESDESLFSRIWDFHVEKLYSDYLEYDFIFFVRSPISNVIYKKTEDKLSASHFDCLIVLYPDDELLKAQIAHRVAKGEADETDSDVTRNQKRNNQYLQWYKRQMKINKENPNWEFNFFLATIPMFDKKKSQICEHYCDLLFFSRNNKETKYNISVVKEKLELCKTNI